MPVKEQDIVAPFAGRVIEVRYQVGDGVRAGAIVAIIQSNALVQRTADLEAAIGDARKDSQAKEEHWRNAESSAAKTRALYDQDLIARRDVEEAQRAVDAARAQIDFARARLAQQEAMLRQLRGIASLSRLPAPFAGIISRRQVERGATVAESAPVVSIADVSILSMTARVPHLDAGAIRSGQTAEVFDAGSQSNSWSGKVTRVDCSKTGDMRDCEVEIQVSGVTAKFSSGTTVEATVELGKSAAAFWLARSAVLSIKGQHHIYKLTDGKAWLRQVTLGVDRGTEVEIKTGLMDGDLVILEPPAKLVSGRRVKLATPPEERSAK